MKKVLVTGAMGTIGNHVISELLKYDVRIIASSIEGSVPSGARAWADSPKVRYIGHDISRRENQIFRKLDKPDIMIHLAWGGLPDYGNMVHLEKGLFDSYYFAKQMIEEGLGELTVAGTCFEYGLKNGPLSEEMETSPVMPYALAKDTLRKFMEELRKKREFGFKWLRIFYLTGKGLRKESLLSKLDEAIAKGDKVFKMSPGDQLRDFLPVETLSEYICKIALSGYFSGVVNCGSGKPVSVRRLVEDHLKAQKKSVELRLGYYPYSAYEPMAFWADTRRLESILGKFKR